MTTQMSITKQDFIRRQKNIYKEIIDNAFHLKQLIPIKFNNQGGYNKKQTVSITNHGIK